MTVLSLLCVWTAGNLTKSENGRRADHRTLRHKIDSQDWRHCSSQFTRQTISPCAVGRTARSFHTAVAISNAQWRKCCGMYC